MCYECTPSLFTTPRILQFLHVKGIFVGGVRQKKFCDFNINASINFGLLVYNN